MYGGGLKITNPFPKVLPDLASWTKAQLEAVLSASGDTDFKKKATIPELRQRLALLASGKELVPPPPPIKIGYKCDGCKKAPITGTRFNCVACSGKEETFDLCQACFAESMHEHDMVALRQPQCQACVAKQAQLDEGKKQYEQLKNSLQEELRKCQAELAIAKQLQQQDMQLQQQGMTPRVEWSRSEPSSGQYSCPHQHLLASDARAGTSSSHST